jgi:hypothetical protein
MQYFVQGSEVFRIHRIQVFFGLPDPDPIVRGMDPALDPDPDPSIIMHVGSLSGIFSPDRDDF